MAVIFNRPERGLTFFETLSRARSDGLRLRHHPELDRHLVEQPRPAQLSDHYPARAPPLVAYAAPHEPLGETIRYENLLLPVPERLRGKTDILLAIPDTMPDGTPLFHLHSHDAGFSILLPDLEAIQIIERFPAQDGLYKIEDRFGLPVDEPAEPGDPRARRLHRADGAYIGFIVRSAFDSDGFLGTADDLINIYLNSSPSDKFFALAEGPNREPIVLASPHPEPDRELTHPHSEPAPSNPKADRPAPNPPPSPAEQGAPSSEPRHAQPVGPAIIITPDRSGEADNAAGETTRPSEPDSISHPPVPFEQSPTRFFHPGETPKLPETVQPKPLPAFTPEDLAALATGHLDIVRGQMPEFVQQMARELLESQYENELQKLKGQVPDEVIDHLRHYGQALRTAELTPPPPTPGNEHLDFGARPERAEDRGPGPA